MIVDTSTMSQKTTLSSALFASFMGVSQNWGKCAKCLSGLLQESGLPVYV
jgi:bacterioferritin-associated ferredoxin